MQELKKDFPPGVDSVIIYDPTTFITKSIHEVIVTIFVAILLVVGVVFLFLQSWRATIIPVIAIPVSLVGTFTILAAFGISLNNLSLFGLVLAVGIVVDDAIVVVENVERNIRDGVSPLQAAHRTMDEVGGALRFRRCGGPHGHDRRRAGSRPSRAARGFSGRNRSRSGRSL